MTSPEVFTAEHDLTLVTIADLIAYRRSTRRRWRAIVSARIPTQHGEFRAVGYRTVLDGRDHIALVRGDIGDGEQTCSCASTPSA